MLNKLLLKFCLVAICCIGSFIAQSQAPDVVVAKDGTISDVVAETKHGFGMEAEAVKIIKKGPKWTPALQNGRNVNAYHRQPITFIVQE